MSVKRLFKKFLTTASMVGLIASNSSNVVEAAGVKTITGNVSLSNAANWSPAIPASGDGVSYGGNGYTLNTDVNGFNIFELNANNRSLGDITISNNTTLGSMYDSGVDRNITNINILSGMELVLSGTAFLGTNVDKYYVLGDVHFMGPSTITFQSSGSGIPFDNNFLGNTANSTVNIKGYTIFGENSIGNLGNINIYGGNTLNLVAATDFNTTNIAFPDDNGILIAAVGPTNFRGQFTGSGIGSASLQLGGDAASYTSTIGDLGIIRITGKHELAINTATTFNSTNIYFNANGATLTFNVPNSAVNSPFKGGQMPNSTINVKGDTIFNDSTGGLGAIGTFNLGANVFILADTIFAKTNVNFTQPNVDIEILSNVTFAGPFAGPNISTSKISLLGDDTPITVTLSDPSLNNVGNIAINNGSTLIINTPVTINNVIISAQPNSTIVSNVDGIIFNGPGTIDSTGIFKVNGNTEFNNVLQLASTNIFIADGKILTSTGANVRFDNNITFGLNSILNCATTTPGATTTLAAAINNGSGGIINVNGIVSLEDKSNGTLGKFNIESDSKLKVDSSVIFGKTNFSYVGDNAILEINANNVDLGSGNIDGASISSGSLVLNQDFTASNPQIGNIGNIKLNVANLTFISNASNIIYNSNFTFAGSNIVNVIAPATFNGHLKATDTDITTALNVNADTTVTTADLQYFPIVNIYDGKRFIVDTRNNDITLQGNFNTTRDSNNAEINILAANSQLVLTNSSGTPRQISLENNIVPASTGYGLMDIISPVAGVNLTIGTTGKSYGISGKCLGSTTLDGLGDITINGDLFTQNLYIGNITDLGNIVFNGQINGCPSCNITIVNNFGSITLGINNNLDKLDFNGKNGYINIPAGDNLEVEEFINGGASGGLNFGGGNGILTVTGKPGTLGVDIINAKDATLVAGGSGLILTTTGGSNFGRIIINTGVTLESSALGAIYNGIIEFEGAGSTLSMVKPGTLAGSFVNTLYGALEIHADTTATTPDIGNIGQITVDSGVQLIVDAIYNDIILQNLGSDINLTSPSAEVVLTNTSKVDRLIGLGDHLIPENSGNGLVTVIAKEPGVGLTVGANNATIGTSNLCFNKATFGGLGDITVLSSVYAKTIQIGSDTNVGSVNFKALVNGCPGCDLVFMQNADLVTLANNATFGIINWNYHNAMISIGNSQTVTANQVINGTSNTIMDFGGGAGEIKIEGPLPGIFDANPINATLANLTANINLTFSNPAIGNFGAIYWGTGVTINSAVAGINYIGDLHFAGANSTLTISQPATISGTISQGNNGVIEALANLVVTTNDIGTIHRIDVADNISVTFDTVNNDINDITSGDIIFQGPNSTVIFTNNSNNNHAVSIGGDITSTSNGVGIVKGVSPNLGTVLTIGTFPHAFGSNNNCLKEFVVDGKGDLQVMSDIYAQTVRIGETTSTGTTTFNKSFYGCPTCNLEFVNNAKQVILIQDATFGNINYNSNIAEILMGSGNVLTVNQILNGGTTGKLNFNNNTSYLDIRGADQAVLDTAILGAGSAVLSAYINLDINNVDVGSFGTITIGSDTVVSSNVNGIVYNGILNAVGPDSYFDINKSATFKGTIQNGSQTFIRVNSDFTVTSQDIAKADNINISNTGNLIIDSGYNNIILGTTQPNILLLGHTSTITFTNSIGNNNSISTGQTITASNSGDGVVGVWSPIAGNTLTVGNAGSSYGASNSCLYAVNVKGHGNSIINSNIYANNIIIGDNDPVGNITFAGTINGCPGCNLTYINNSNLTNFNNNATFGIVNWNGYDTTVKIESEQIFTANQIINAGSASNFDFASGTGILKIDGNMPGILDAGINNATFAVLEADIDLEVENAQIGSFGTINIADEVSFTSAANNINYIGALNFGQNSVFIVNKPALQTGIINGAGNTNFIINSTFRATSFEIGDVPSTSIRANGNLIIDSGLSNITLANNISFDDIAAILTLTNSSGNTNVIDLALNIAPTVSGHGSLKIVGPTIAGSPIVVGKAPYTFGAPGLCLKDVTIDGPGNITVLSNIFTNTIYVGEVSDANTAVGTATFEQVKGCNLCDLIFNQNADTMIFNQNTIFGMINFNGKQGRVRPGNVQLTVNQILGGGLIDLINNGNLIIDGNVVPGILDGGIENAGGATLTANINLNILNKDVGGFGVINLENGITLNSQAPNINFTGAMNFTNGSLLLINKPATISAKIQGPAIVNVSALTNINSLSAGQANYLINTGGVLNSDFNQLIHTGTIDFNHNNGIWNINQSADMEPNGSIVNAEKGTMNLNSAFETESPSIGGVHTININQNGVLVLGLTDNDIPLLQAPGAQINLTDPSAILIMINESLNDRNVPFNGAITANACGEGAILLGSNNPGVMLNIGSANSSIGAVGTGVREVMYVDKGDVTVKSALFTKSIIIGAGPIRDADVGNIVFEAPVNPGCDASFLQFKQTAQNVRFNDDTHINTIDYNNIASPITIGNGVNVVTDQVIQGNAGSMKFIGDGTFTGKIINLALFEVGAGNGEFKTAGPHTITEIRGNGNKVLTLPDGFNLDGTIDNPGNAPVQLAFKGDAVISGKVGTTNAIGDVFIEQGKHVTFKDSINVGNMHVNNVSTLTLQGTVNHGGNLTVAGNSTLDLPNNTAIKMVTNVSNSNINLYQSTVTFQSNVVLSNEIRIALTTIPGGSGTGHIVLDNNAGLNFTNANIHLQVTTANANDAIGKTFPIFVNNSGGTIDKGVNVVVQDSNSAVKWIYLPNTYEITGKAAHPVTPPLPVTPGGSGEDLDGDILDGSSPGLRDILTRIPPTEREKVINRLKSEVSDDAQLVGGGDVAGTAIETVVNDVNSLILGRLGGNMTRFGGAFDNREVNGDETNNILRNINGRDGNSDNEGNNIRDVMCEGMASGDSAVATRYGAWGAPFYSVGTQKVTGQSSAYKMKAGGGALGYDYLLSDTSLVGIAYAFVNTNIKYRGLTSGDKLNIKTHLLSAYGMQQLPKDFFLQGILSGTYNKLDNKNIGGADSIGYSTARAKFSSQSYSAEAMLGRNFLVNDTIITPLGGLIYSHFTEKAYREQGSSIANLHVAKKKHDKLELIAGLRTSIQIEDKGLLYTPELHGFVYHDLIGKKLKSKVRIVGASANFPTRTIKPVRTSYNIGTGLTVSKGNLEYSATYDMQLARKYVGHQGTLKFKVKF